MRPLGQKAMKILDQHGITMDDFNYKDQGTAYKYFHQFSNGVHTSSKGARIQGAMVSSSDWPNKKGRNFQALKQLAETQLMPLLNEMVAYDKKNYIGILTANCILENYYAFGLITDVTRKLREYKDENNLMLLSDASQFLNGIINDSDTPFIYEKVGSYFQNYLIDEFQDTSGFQWKNFIPLLKEAGDQGNTNLIVGDVKQSIYRWRGGDLELLQSEITKEFGANRVSTVPLVTNYRSAGKIIEFNNLFFKRAVPTITEIVGNDLPAQVYSDVTQNIASLADEGFVNVIFKEDTEEEDWKVQVLNDLPGWLEKLQVDGAQLKDIAILVRKNEEGQRIANHLLQFRHSSAAKKGFRYDVVSNESLRLDSAQSVNVIISAIRHLKNPDDLIARGQLAYEISESKGLDQLFMKARMNQLQELLPVEFMERTRALRKLSLFELTEELIRIFDLGSQIEELAYIQAFQDTVLEFSAREKTDLGSFLEWWEIYKEKKSIQVSANVDAVNILTIHKSKGLQFKYVIIPFCDWSLNHDISPLIWVESDRKPFGEMGPLAVRYSSSLKETLFAEHYQTEFTKVHLDNLNLLYVAFTRAEAGMIVFLRQRDKEKMSNVGDLVHNTINESEMLGLVKDGMLQWGEFQTPKKKFTDDSSMIQLNQYTSFDWRKKLVIKRQGSEFFEDEVSEKRSKINRGILVHQVLSRIHHKADAEGVLTQFLMETALPKDEAEKLKEDINKLLTHAQIGGWFAKDWTVKTEALVLLPGFQQKRIDRIMFGHNRTVLVDYKTGKKKPEDKDQVERYAQVLTQMGYPNVQAYLLYLQDLKVDEVVNKSNLSLF
jgi:ATP-dependent helicase/nuclease subunit A